MNRKNVEIRKKLHQIVESAYRGKNSQMLEKYKKFYFEIHHKSLKTIKGKYDEDKKQIVVMGLHRPDEYIFVTAVTYLAQHILSCEAKNKNKKEDYENVYKKLIEAAIREDIINSHDVSMCCTSSDLAIVHSILKI